MQMVSLTSLIACELKGQLDLDVVVDQQGRSITLHGQVPSAAACQTAQQIAASIAPDSRIENYLEVEVDAPEANPEANPYVHSTIYVYWEDRPFDLPLGAR